jgi:hypothetical protein
MAEITSAGEASRAPCLIRVARVRNVRRTRTRASAIGKGGSVRCDSVPTPLEVAVGTCRQD